MTIIKTIGQFLWILLKVLLQTNIIGNFNF